MLASPGDKVCCCRKYIMYTKKVYNTCLGVFTVYKVRMYAREYTDYDVHSLVVYTKSVYSVHIFH